MSTFQKWTLTLLNACKSTTETTKNAEPSPFLRAELRAALWLALRAAPGGLVQDRPLRGFDLIQRVVRTSGAA